MTFEGIPVSALDFYDDLEMDNTKSFWEAHKDTYRVAVKEPMTALARELADEFGPAKIFRPHRDTRFASDKTPYKTHQGAFVAAATATGWYLEVSAQGVRTSAGFYAASTESLARIRQSIDNDLAGEQLATILNKVRAAGFEVGGERLKTSPRGYEADHPRIDLLRHKSVAVGHLIGFDPVIHTPRLVQSVRKDWRALRPLVEWVASRVE